MEVLQNEWKAQGLVRITPYHRAIEINWLKKKEKVLTKLSDIATVEKMEAESTRLESETLKERTQCVKANATAKASGSEEKARNQEEARQQKKEQEEHAQHEKEIVIGHGLVLSLSGVVC